MTTEEPKEPTFSISNLKTKEDWLMHCWMCDLRLDQTMFLLMVNGYSATEEEIMKFGETSYAEMMRYYEEQARLNYEANLEFEEEF